MKKIYVACPAYLKTGGPELLHQFVNCGVKNGFDVSIAYYDIEAGKNPIHNEYQKYVDSYVELSSVKDIDDNIIIFPETQTARLYDYKKAKKVIWWLSVDFWRGFYKKDKYLFIKRFLNKILGRLYFRTQLDSIKLADCHLYQSEYARLYLEKMGYKNSFALSDYINDSFFEQSFYNEKNDVVLYNPKKGYEFTMKIIEASRNEFNFIPIKNLTTKQVSELLSKSKVYIDFGNHPGKDRFPREAAISGCCVVTGKRGAANNDLDVRIPEKYKFEDDERNISDILTAIRFCIEQYDRATRDFVTYKEFISNEKNIFEKQVKEILEMLYKL